MVQNFINFLTGNNMDRDNGSNGDINRMQLEFEKTKLERELSNISDTMIRSI